MQVTVLALIRAKAEHQDAVKEALLALVPPTHQEEGCLDYVLHQSSEDPALFMFYENWKSREELDQHLQTSYIQNFLRKTDQMLAEPVDLKLFEKIG